MGILNEMGEIQEVIDGLEQRLKQFHRKMQEEFQQIIHRVTEESAHVYRTPAVANEPREMKLVQGLAMVNHGRNLMADALGFKKDSFVTSPLSNLDEAIKMIPQYLDNILRQLREPINVAEEHKSSCRAVTSYGRLACDCGSIPAPGRG